MLQSSSSFKPPSPSRPLPSNRLLFLYPPPPPPFFLSKVQHLIQTTHLYSKRRRANVLLAFNNFSAKESVPLLDELRNLGEAVGAVKGLDLAAKVGGWVGG